MRLSVPAVLRGPAAEALLADLHRAGADLEVAAAEMRRRASILRAEAEVRRRAMLIEVGALPR